MLNIKNKTVGYALIFLIVALAFFVRAYNIDNAPSGIYPDEAVNGIDALRANQNNDHRWFYEDNNGREGLFMNIISLSFRVFGVSFFSLKLPSILIGTLTVFGVYLLAKQLFRSTRSGLIASYLTAVSFWPINFSRISFRAIMLPAVMVFSTYFLVLGIRTRKFIHFIFAGLIFGIGLHTYIAFRISPLVLLIFIIAVWITKKDFLKDYWKHLLLFAFSALITMSPMLYDFYKHPEHLSSRSASVSILAPEVNHGQLIKTAFTSLGLSLVKYNLWGDQNWRHNYPPYPILNPIIGISFAIGLVYVIIKFLHLLYLRFKRNIRDRKLYIYALIIAWFFGMLSPEFLTAEGLPHALRAIGTLPVVFIIATIPILWIEGRIEEQRYLPKVFNYSIIFAILLLIGIFDIAKYHYFWTSNPKQAEAFEQNLTEASDYIQTIPNDRPIIVIAENMQRIPIHLFNYNNSNIQYVHPDELDRLLENSNDQNIFILINRADWISDKILQKYPTHKLEKMDGKFFKDSFRVIK